MFCCPNSKLTDLPHGYTKHAGYCKEALQYNKNKNKKDGGSESWAIRRGATSN